MNLDQVAVSLLTQETCGDALARKALTGTATLESWTGSACTSSSEQCERNVESLALNVKGQDQSSEKIFLFVEDWDPARVALGCHMALGVPGSA